MKRTMIAIAVALVTFPAGARADDDHVARRAQARLEADEPTVKEAVAAALRYAGLARGGEAGIRRRARLAAVLPTLTLRATRDTSWNEDSSDGDRVVGEVDQKVVLEARMTWRLDRLVFDGAELRIASLGQQRARARATLAAQTTALYYKRRAAQVEELWHPAGTMEEAVQRELVLEELSAQLSVLTGGWWDEQ